MSSNSAIPARSRRASYHLAGTDWQVRLICVLFFFSGFPALIYQLVWERALFRILGVNMESVTIVVAAFMLGLGLGSLAGGWLSNRRRIPLLTLLAGIEFLTGLFALFSLQIFDRGGTLVIGMPVHVTAVTALLLVIVPTLLMGATLPLLVGHLVRRSRNVGGSLGLLYYVNTLGAATACFMAPAVLFPFFGMQRAIYSGVILNWLVAAGAATAQWYQGGRRVEIQPETMPSTPAETVPCLSFLVAVGLAFLSGFVSLSYEMFCFRTLSYATASSAVAFAATLGTFLLGLASGSRQAGRASMEHPEQLKRRLAREVISANLVGLLFLPVLSFAAAFGAVPLLGLGMVMVYLLARSWGWLLPGISHFGVMADHRAGLHTAFIYLGNILGSASGTVLTGFVLMDILGLSSIGALLVVIGLGTAVLLITALPLPKGAKLVSAGAAASVGFAVVLLPSLSTNVLENLLWKGGPSSDGAFASVVENRTGIITVDKTGTVFGNGAYDGRFNIDLVHDTNGILRPFALSLFHPAPREVLMIGLSSGSWAQVIASNPEVERLTVIELNPGYLRLISGRPEVASVLTNSKVSIIADDGRRWLRLHPDRRFDAIVSNTTWNFRANTTNLLSFEFLELVKNHLERGGVFFYNTTDSARVQRTGCLSFPFGARFTNHMVVSTEPVAWDFERWSTVLTAYRIDGHPVPDVREADRLMRLSAELAGTGQPGQDRFIESCPEILARTAGKIPVTDDNMGTEWRYVLGLE